MAFYSPPSSDATSAAFIQAMSQLGGRNFDAHVRADRRKDALRAALMQGLASGAGQAIGSVADRFITEPYKQGQENTRLTKELGARSDEGRANRQNALDLKAMDVQGDIDKARYTPRAIPAGATPVDPSAARTWQRMMGLTKTIYRHNQGTFHESVDPSWDPTDYQEMDTGEGLINERNLTPDTMKSITDGIAELRSQNKSDAEIKQILHSIYADDRRLAGTDAAGVRDATRVGLEGFNADTGRFNAETNRGELTEKNRSNVAGEKLGVANLLQKGNEGAADRASREYLAAQAIAGNAALSFPNEEVAGRGAAMIGLGPTTDASGKPMQPLPGIGDVIGRSGQPTAPVGAGSPDDSFIPNKLPGYAGLPGAPQPLGMNEGAPGVQRALQTLASELRGSGRNPEVQRQIFQQGMDAIHRGDQRALSMVINRYGLNAADYAGLLAGGYQPPQPTPFSVQALGNLPIPENQPRGPLFNAPLYR